MATVASILGQSEFDLDASSRSVSGGNTGATTSGGGGDRTGENDDSASPDGGRDADSSRRVVNPASATPADNDDASGGNRRGNSRNARQRNASGNASESRTRGRKETGDSDIEIDALLIVIHSIIARVLDAPEFEIMPNEAALLGKALKRVMKFVTKTVLSPQQEAIAALLVVLAAIYVPRYFVWSARQPKKGKTVINVPPKRVETVGVKLG